MNGGGKGGQLIQYVNLCRRAFISHLPEYVSERFFLILITLPPSQSMLISVIVQRVFALSLPFSFPSRSRIVVLTQPRSVKSSRRRPAASWGTVLLRAPSPAMAPHMNDTELDWVMRQARSRKTPSEIHDLLEVKRGRLGTQAPHITNIRKAIQCKTYKRCRQEQDAAAASTLATK